MTYDLLWFMGVNIIHADAQSLGLEIHRPGISRYNVGLVEHIKLYFHYCKFDINFSLRSERERERERERDSSGNEYISGRK